MSLRKKDEPLKIGLTGGAGCGKSFALNYLQSKGFKVVDCDAVVHDLLEKDPAIRKSLSDRWGKKILTSQGHVDRSKIAAIVFSNDNELAFLEGLLHPRVQEYWQSKIAADHNPKDRWLIEIPLLFETNLETLFHSTVCITSTQELQLQRLEERGLSAEQVQARMEKQMPLLEKMQKADYVIMNNGTQSFFMKQLDRLSALLV